MKHLLALVILTLLSKGLLSQYDSLIWDGLDRTYLLHLPTDYQESDKSPLVIAMHGGFGSAANLQNQSQLSQKADQENFIVVYPEGVRAGLFNIRTWNAGWCCGKASESDVDDVGFINALMDTLIEKYAIDEDRIYATGMSNGGFMSFRLACELSDRIAAIAPVAASMSMVECTPTEKLPVIQFHSYLDASVPPQGGIGSGPSDHYNPPLDSVLNFWADIDSCSNVNDTIVNSNQYTHIAWTGCSCNYRIEHYISKDGGHSWPGGMATPLGDPVSDFVNASDLMWSFFEGISLNCPGASSTNFAPKKSFQIYPNPSASKIYITPEITSQDFKASIYSILGDKIKDYKKSHEFDISEIEAGTYFLRLEANEEVYLRKFIKVD